MRPTRRTFLKTIGSGALGAASVATVKACRSLVPEPTEALEIFTPSEDYPYPGAAKWVSSVCLQCKSGCGILVKLYHGKVVKIEGNPLHPVNQGGLCPKGQALPQVLYNPLRIRQPMKRIGARASGRWQPIGWDEAITTVTEKLALLRQTQPQALALWTERCSGLMRQLWERFFEAYGSPNCINLENNDAEVAANYYTLGQRSLCAYDWDRVKYLLSFENDFLEEGPSVGRMHRAHGQMKQWGSRTKIVHVGPRLSVTAARSDEWIPIEPGTSAALALGIAHVLIDGELYDEEFVEKRTFGFHDWIEWESSKGVLRRSPPKESSEGVHSDIRTFGHSDIPSGRRVRHPGFKTLVLRDYTPEKVSRITGVPPETIRRIAREFAVAQPGVAISGSSTSPEFFGASRHTNGLHAHMAINALNALVGNFERHGGILTQHVPPFARFPPVAKDSIARTGLSQVPKGCPNVRMSEWTPSEDSFGGLLRRIPKRIHQLSGSIVNKESYPLKVLFVHNANPCYASANLSVLQRTLRGSEEPFIVTFSSFWDDTAEYADLILPEHTNLEKWQDAVVNSADGYPIFGIAQPAVDPLYDTRHTGDVVLQIAHNLGGNIARSFPWNDFQSVLMYAVEGVYRTNQGSIGGFSFKSSFAEFWDELLLQGVWYDQPYHFGRVKWNTVFQTPSGKFEFYSQKMKQQFAALHRKEHGEESDETYLPHHEPPRFAGDAAAYPLHLHLFQLLPLSDAVSPNQPWLLEIAGVHVNTAWETWAEINPITAQRLDIADGDWVWIESPVARIKVRAKLYPGAMPNVINVPLGFGHQIHHDNWSTRGENPWRLLVEEVDPMTKSTAPGTTRVKVYKA